MGGMPKKGGAGGLALALAALALMPAAGRAETFDYVVVLSFEADPDLPRYAHTFAAFVRATGSGARPECYAVEAHTISWYPASGEVRVARLCPECGVNLGLADTLDRARRLGAHVSRRGPYRICPGLFERARAQAARLRSGAVHYKVLDVEWRPTEATNCIHAIADLDTEGGLLRTGFAWGDEAGALVAWHLRRWMIDPDRRHDWVWDRLGLGGCPVAVQPWGRLPGGR